MLQQHLLLIFVWMIFCWLHSWFAATGFKKSFQKKFRSGSRYYRLYYTLFAFISLIAVVWFQFNIKTVFVFHPNFLLKGAGIVTGSVGLVIMLLCIKKYFLSLSGLKSLLTEAGAAKLMTDGLHNHLRHPLYLGTFMTLWGAFLFIPYWSLLLSNVVITIYTLIGIRLEEKKLLMEFGTDYSNYMNKVPMLFPWLFFNREKKP